MTTRTTIVGAITQVLRKEKAPMTTGEIHQAIERDKLYTFNARNPVSIIGTQLRRHTEGTTMRAAAKTKHFGRTPDGKYYLLQQ